MKMKKFMMVAMSALLIATLGACRGGRGGRGSGTSGDDSQSSGSSSGLKPKPGSSSGTSSGGKTSTSQSGDHTTESVIKDICIAEFEDVTDPQLNTHYWVDGSDYYTFVGFDDEYASEEYLEPAVELVADDLPSYLTATSEIEKDTWDSGSKGYFQTFAVGSITVELGSMLDSTDGLLVQILVYEE